MKAENMRLGLPVQVKPKATDGLRNYVGRHGIIKDFGIISSICYVQFKPNGVSVVARADELKRVKQ
jgi:hypothetical protein